MTTTHSPLPWRIDETGLRAMVRASDATIVALRHRLPADVNEANVALIVHAVNSLPELQAEAGYLASINAVQEATISRLTADRDELKSQVDALNGDVWRLGTKVGRLTAAFDAVRFKLEILATESELAQDALECLTSSDPDAERCGAR